MLQDYSSSVLPYDTSWGNYGILANWCNYEDIKIWVRQLDELSAHGVSTSDLEKCLHYELTARIHDQIIYNGQGEPPTQTQIRLNLFVFPESVKTKTQTCTHMGWNQSWDPSSINYQRDLGLLAMSSFNYVQWRQEYIASIDSSYIHSYSNLTTHQEIIDGFIAIVNGFYDKTHLINAGNPWDWVVTKQQGRLTITPYGNGAVTIDVNTLKSNTPSASSFPYSLTMYNFKTGIQEWFTNVKTVFLDSAGDLQGWRYANIGGLIPVPGLVSITPRDTSVDEGGNLEFDIVTENIADGDSVAWSLTNAADFATSSGSTTITSNTGSFTVSPTLDNTTEGVEVFTAEIHYNSVTLASADVTINVTSLDPPPT